MDLKNGVFNTLALSGGSVKAIATIGSLYYLQKEGHIDFIENYIGTSAGGIICYLLCIGYKPFDIICFLCKSNLLEEFQNLNITHMLEQKGLINYYIFQEYIEKLTINKIGFLPTFKDLRQRFGKNLTLTTFNMTKNVVEYLNYENTPDMPCMTAIRMTANVPILFDRFFYNNCEYLDGGIVNNFPIDYYKGDGYKTIGVNIGQNNSVSSKVGYLYYLLKIAMIPCSFFKMKQVNTDKLTIITVNTDVNIFDFNLSITKRLDLFSSGYQSAKQAYDEEKPTKEEVKEKVQE